MDMLSAYREVGTYRGAAAICGTTAKTVRRAVERHNAGGGERPRRRARERNYASVAELVAERVAVTRARISAKRLLPAARTDATAGRHPNDVTAHRERAPFWYASKAQPSTADMLAKLRRVLIAARFRASRSFRDDQPTPAEIHTIRLAWDNHAA